MLCQAEQVVVLDLMRCISEEIDLINPLCLDETLLIHKSHQCICKPPLVAINRQAIMSSCNQDQNNCGSPPEVVGVLDTQTLSFARGEQQAIIMMR